MAIPVVTSVSHATRALGSLARIASRIASEIWSAILSGWPSVTEPEQKDRGQGLGRHSAADAGGLPRRARRFGHELQEPEHARVVRREAVGEPRVAAIHHQRVLREVVRADAQEIADLRETVG